MCKQAMHYCPRHTARDGRTLIVQNTGGALHAGVAWNEHGRRVEVDAESPGRGEVGASGARKC